MPNWCENKVTVQGSVEETGRFMEYVKGEDIHKQNGDITKNHFCFNKIIPMPEDIYQGNLGEKERKKYGNKNWYDWCIENWGTKWSPTGVHLDPTEGDELLEYRFNTAWGPPKGIYDHLHKEFPSLSISWFYNEPGVEFAGYLNTDDELVNSLLRR